MNLIPFFIIIPLGTAFIMPLLFKMHRRIQDFLAVSVSLSLVVLSWSVAKIVAAKEVLVYRIGSWPPPTGICLVLDGLSSLMLIVVGMVTFLVTLYTPRYMDKFTDRARFYSLFMLLLAGMNGVILTGDLFNLFVFFEIAVIASYALVAFGVDATELEAAFKYQVLSSLASMCILLGIAFIYSWTGSLNMADISNIILQQGLSKTIALAGLLFIVGFGLKADLVPFHAWLPDAHPAAPAPVSAMLSGIFIKIVGVYALVRVLFNVIGVNQVFMTMLLVLGIITMVIGGFLAIGQDDIKRLFAYSSTSQIGYIFIGLALGTPLGIFAGLFHLINHSFFKSLLFLNAGAIEYATGTREFKRMGNLSDSMPVTAGTSLVGAMAISGIPPLNGFWSKLFIIFACIQAGRFYLAVTCLAMSIITLAYYLRVMDLAFSRRETKAVTNKVHEVPMLMQAAMIILAIICIAMGIFFPLIRSALLNPAARVLSEGTKYANAILGAIR